jgi:gamma-D-glutamyl-L-lysine dipeptidyl-peptidase
MLSRRVCGSPVVNLRKTSEDTSEVVSQVLFGEEVICLQESQLKTLVQTPDGYQGWVYSACLVPDYQGNMTTSRLVVPIYWSKLIRLGPMFYLPFGVSVKVIDTEQDWNTIELPGKEICYIQSGNLVDQISFKDLYSLTTQFLGIPYIWGGRSSFGFDCSGFSQMIYRYLGFLLPRDSSDQAKDCRFKETSQPKIGDLIFWGQSIDQISHVGISIGNEQFIHASIKEQMPWVRISSLHDAAWNCGVGAAYPFRVFKTLS